MSEREELFDRLRKGDALAVREIIEAVNRLDALLEVTKIRHQRALVRVAELCEGYRAVLLSKAKLPEGRPDSMTLPEFVSEQRHCLDEFFEMWRANTQDNPADYPGEMSPGDWDEQLEVFHVVP